MPQLIPGIGARGLFTLKPPFAAKLLPATPYQCVAVRKLEDIAAAGGDPKALYYTANGLSDADYQADLAAGVVIVSLQASAAEWLYVPSTYIQSMPDQGGIPYTTMAVAVSLGPVANSLDLTYLKTKMKDLASEVLGLDPLVVEAHAMAISATSNVTQTEHAALEAARAVRIAETQTDHAQLLAMTAQRDAAVQRSQEIGAALARYIELYGPLPPETP